MTSTSGRVIVAAFIIILCLQNVQVRASGIPIWELLTRNEKMSFLYSNFAQLVSGHCKVAASKSNVPVNKCKRDLLAYGHSQLRTFSNFELDAIDPYQRGANELLWTAIMQNQRSKLLINTQKPIPTPPASSIIILTAQKEAMPKSSTAERRFLTNPIFSEANSNTRLSYAMNSDNYRVSGPPRSTYLGGSLFFRVHPDGTPVNNIAIRR